MLHARVSLFPDFLLRKANLAPTTAFVLFHRIFFEMPPVVLFAVC